MIAARHLSRDDVFFGTDTLGQSLAGGGYDAKELVGSLTTPPSALAIGRVTIQFGNGRSELQDLSRYHDVSDKRITSTTGQLVWDYGKRIVEVRSPKTQAIIGFADDQSFDLPGAEVKVETPFVSLIFTPLDNADLVDSRHLSDHGDGPRQTNWNRVQRRLFAIDTDRGPPLLMEPVQALIKLKGSRPSSVRPCDLDGVPRSEQLEIGSDGSFKIDGRSRTYYYEVRR